MSELPKVPHPDKTPLELHIKLSKFEVEQLLAGKIDFVEVVGPIFAGVFPTIMVIELEKEAEK
jgi:hypothetical protein